MKCIWILISFNAIRAGNPKYDTAAKRLFTKLEDEGILSDGLLWWDDLLEVIIRGSAEAQLSGATPSKKIKEKRNILVCHCKVRAC